MAARRGEGHRPLVFGTPFGLLFIAAAALLMLLPLGEGPAKVLAIPHLVLLPVFFFTLRPVEGVGPVGAFAAGLSVDVLTYGPLGVTAAAMLAVHFVLRRERDALMALPAIFRLTGFAVAAGFVLAISSVSMAVLGPRGWPGPVEVATAFAGLLTIAIVVELVRAGIGSGGLRPGRGLRLRKKTRRRPKPRRPAGSITRAMGRSHRGLGSRLGSRLGTAVRRRGSASLRGLVGRRP